MVKLGTPVYKVSGAASLWARHGPGDEAYYARVIRDLAQKEIMTPYDIQGFGRTAAQRFTFEEVCRGKLLSMLSQMSFSMNLLREFRDKLQSKKFTNAIDRVLRDQGESYLVVRHGQSKSTIQFADERTFAEYIEGGKSEFFVVFNIRQSLLGILGDGYDGSWPIEPDGYAA